VRTGGFFLICDIFHLSKDMTFVSRIAIVVAINNSNGVNQDQAFFTRIGRAVVKIKHLARLHIGLDTSRNQLNLPWRNEGALCHFQIVASCMSRLSLGQQIIICKAGNQLESTNFHAFLFSIFTAPIILNSLKTSKKTADWRFSLV